MVHGLEIDYWGQIEFAYLDIDDPAVASFKEELGFRYQPQIFLIDGAGNVVQEFAGNQPEEILREALDALLASS